MNIDSIIAPYGRTVVRLLKGPVEATDTNAWEDILNYQSEINKYLMNIGGLPDLSLASSLVSRYR